MLTELFAGFATVLTDPSALLWCLIGITIGTLVGALPGIGPVSGLSMLLPLTFQLDKLDALILLMSVFLGCKFGGRITSILMNVPGDADALVSTFDGYPLARQGRAGYALTLSAIAAFIGGTFGILGMVFFTNLLAKFALVFGPAEYFSLMVFAMIATCGLMQKNPLKPVISMFLGLMLATIGLDSVTGEQRLTFGVVNLWDGIDYTVIGIGMFGLSEALIRLEQGRNLNSQITFGYSSLFPKIHEVISNVAAMIRGSVIGFLIGVLPGMGGILATFLSYNAEKKVSKHPEKFGTGVPQGLSAPEAAVSAGVGGDIITTFALGIPGSGSAAILLGGLMMVGLQPGPLLFKNSGDIVWAAFAGLFIANILLLIMNTLFVPVFAKLIQKVDAYIVPLITVLCFVGVYTLNFSLFDVGLMIFFGVFGYIMEKNGFPLVPLFLGVILGPDIEKNLRQALSISKGDFSIFFVNPISLFFIIITIAILLSPMIKLLIINLKESFTKNSYLEN
ncbi:tripartite tricarboxylate transporter permease [Brevibacillus sp. H7]|uniref:tripartite tricarboxylate transporter permease n=1 Tax=Brevibacillus sp. H7 TaxID=3349138 RepID=UPI0037FB4338